MRRDGWHVKSTCAGRFSPPTPSYVNATGMTIRCCHSHISLLRPHTSSLARRSAFSRAAASADLFLLLLLLPWRAISQSSSRAHVAPWNSMVQSHSISSTSFSLRCGICRHLLQAPHCVQVSTFGRDAAAISAGGSRRWPRPQSETEGIGKYNLI